MVWHLPILEVDTGLPPTLGAKIHRANARLDTTSWAPFTNAAAPAQAPMSGDDVDQGVSSVRVTVALAGTQLSVRDANGRAIISRRVPGWAVAPSAGPGGMRCHNPARLADAHLHVPSRTLLLRVAFSEATPAGSPTVAGTRCGCRSIGSRSLGQPARAAASVRPSPYRPPEAIAAAGARC